MRSSWGLCFVVVAASAAVMGCAAEPRPTTLPIASAGSGGPVVLGPRDSVEWEPAERCYEVDLPRGEGAWNAAQPFLELVAREEHPRTEDWEAGMRTLEEAAHHGHLEGQYRFGILLFGQLFTDHAPEPGERDSYVSALFFVRIAALRGHARAASSLPGIALRKLESGTALEEPLSSLPRDWVADAFRSADFWMECHGERLRAQSR